MDCIKIALVDDHKMFREGIKSVLSDEKSIQLVAEAGNAEEIINSLSNCKIDVLITDISLPGMSGIELCRYAKIYCPQLKTLILSMHTDEEFVLDSVKSGASGYLSKETGHEELIYAIRKIAAGEIYFSHNISQTIIQAYRKDKKSTEVNPTEFLSQRELEVLKLYVEGFSNSEIAEKLFISVRTVESHKTHILQKTGLKSHVDLIKLAIKFKLTDL
ncbi:MAG: response regulator transcription factor [Bacteroidales bacterium]|nr:response regulator transcription factor [Bacteroidales bacterium]